MIVNESNGEDETGKKFEKIIDGMKCYTVNELTGVLKRVGFSEVKTVTHPKNPWITVIAKK